MLDALKKGDQVLTTGGLVGRIVDMDGDILTLDLGGTTVNLARSYVVGLTESKVARESKNGKDDK